MLEDGLLLKKYKSIALLIVRFLLAGGIGVATNLSVLYVLTEYVGLYYLVSVVAAFWCSFVVSFILQKYWTFQDASTTQVRRQALLYVSVAAINFCINVALMYLFVDKFHLWYVAAQAVASLLIAILSFFIYRYTIFAQVKS